MSTERSSENVTPADPDTARQLFPLVYAELCELAHLKMRREPAGHTLQTTDLVHEAYVKLAATNVHWDNRSHFFGAAAEAMRRILIDRARKHARPKHGGGRQKVDLAAADVAAPIIGDDVLAIDEALTVLEQLDPVRSSVVKFRYFAGLSIEQTAEVLGISEATVSGHWTYARAWLYREITCRDEEN